MPRLWLALLAALSLAACTHYDSASGTCKRDEDCADGAECVVGTGVCVRFRNPLDAAIPDLAGADLAMPDLQPTDGILGD
jgi:hypothetical protein